jgi:DNA-binding MarR family transcriptional regulator
MTETIPTPEDVADLLLATTRRIRRAFRRDLPPGKVTPAQWQALRTVRRSGKPLRMSELAMRLGIVPRSATDVVDDLEGQGLVHREVDPEDRRSLLVSLTPAGRRRLDALRARRRRAAVQHMAVLEPGELRVLRDLLARLSTAEP